MLFGLESAFAQSVYYIAAPFAPWLWPALAVTGIALQLLATILKKPLLLAGGLILAIAGTIPDRDLTLLTGDILACSGLWYCMRKR